MRSFFLKVHFFRQVCYRIEKLREGLQRYPFVPAFGAKDLVESPTLVVTPKQLNASKIKQ